MRVLVPCLFVVAAAAGEAPQPAPAPKPAPTVAPAPPVNAANAEKPQLGVQIDERALRGIDSGKGLPILHVVPGSTAATLGVQIGDRITAINGTATNAIADLQAAIAALKVGDALKIDIERGANNEKKTLSGTMQAIPKINDFPTQLAETQRKLEDLRGQAGLGKREPTLADVLEMLNQIEKQLPKAAEEFKKQYPNGDFDIKIDVHIVSDKTAKNPVDLVPPDEPKKDAKDQDGAKKDADKKDAAKPDDKPAVDHGAKPAPPAR